MCLILEMYSTSVKFSKPTQVSPKGIFKNPNFAAASSFFDSHCESSHESRVFIGSLLACQNQCVHDKSCLLAEESLI